MAMSQSQRLANFEPNNDKAKTRNANVPKPLTCQQIPLS
jgi:hypothetical protein